MSKVIHTIKNFNSLLHRGQKSKDPYNKQTYFNPARLLLKTLGTSSVNPRCSRTFGNYINNSKNLRIAGFSSAFILLILSALSVYPIVRSLNSAEAVTPTNSTTELSMTSTNTASVELLVKSDSGTFATSVGSQELSFGVTTNNYAGYNLTLYGKDETYNELKNSSTNTSLTSISGSKESSEFSNGSWGYTLDGGNTYLSAPDDETGYKIDTTSTPNKDTAKTYTLGIGARANYSTKAGTYANTYLLIPLANATPYTIYYKDNTNDSSVANLPTTQDEATSAINVNLSETQPTRTGYTFSKWCDGTVSNNGTTCSGTSYNSGDEFGIDRTAASNVTTLYATWTVNSYTLNIANNNTTSNPAISTTINFGGEATITVTPNAGYYLSEVSCPTGYTCSGYTTGSDATGAQTVTVENNGNSTSAAGGTITFTAESSVDGYMQDFTASECDALSDGTTLKLGDRRDGNIYNVTKINGNCWMTQNLRYVGDTGSTSGSMVMKSATSNISTDKTIAYTDLTSGDTYDTARIHDSGNTTTGVWYNYAAASAMSITGESNSNTQTYDVCPKGWRIPTSPEQSNITSQISAFSPVTGGRYNDGINYTPNLGYWWSATPGESNQRYNMYSDGSTLNISSGGARYVGLYIRCIRKTTLDEQGVSTMQDLGSLDSATKKSLVDSLPTGTQYSLTDSRDSQSYTIAKLADGKVWMTKNLNLAGGTKLDSDGSNVPSGYTQTNPYYTLPSSSTSGFSSDTTAYVYNSNSTSCGNNSPCYSYYSWLAATAGGKDSSGNAVTGDGYNAAYSICPKGWKLPSATIDGVSRSNNGYAGGDFYELAIQYGMATGDYFENPDNSPTFYSQAGPGTTPNFLLAGYYSNSSFNNGGSFGYYWSSTSNSSTLAYHLYFNSGYVYSANYYYRGNGFSVRCVLDTISIADATSMQDVTAKMVANMAEGETATLTDVRDNNTYKVTKINGNLWMTQNLRLAGKTTITNENSNITAASYTLPESKTAGFNDYTTANMYCSNSASTGCWYNYMAATAGTISGSSNQTAASQDICPKGWRLPTNSEQSGITSQTTAFSPVTGGFYDNGSVYNTGYGYWWSATAYNNSGRYSLNYNGSSLSTSYSNRRYGFYVRCIRAGA